MTDLSRFKTKTSKIVNPEPKRRAPKGQRFAMLTEDQLKLLAKASGAAFSVYCYLLMVNWKNFNQPIKLTNKMLTELGVFRDAKARALSQLERVGLIKVERLGKRQAPTITPPKVDATASFPDFRLKPSSHVQCIVRRAARVVPPYGLFRVPDLPKNGH
jgi:hypothetical protein